MSKSILYLAFICLIGGAFILGAQQEPATPRVSVPILPKSKALSPVPPSSAKHKSQRSTIGEGIIQINTVLPSTYWEEAVHVGDTSVVNAFLHDAKAGVLYAYRHGDFACNNQTMNGNALEALYTAGNHAGQPVGSGWYIVELDKGECGATHSGIYGCKFTDEGIPGECGPATVNSQTGELVFASSR